MGAHKRISTDLETYVSTLVEDGCDEVEAWQAIAIYASAIGAALGLDQNREEPS